MQIISREDAKRIGLKVYFSGTPCIHGHKDHRFVSNNNCKSCVKISVEKRRKIINERAREAYKSKGHIYKKEYAIKNKERIKEYRDSIKFYLREKALKYYYANKDRQRHLAKLRYTAEYSRKYYYKTLDKNKHKYAMYAANRRAMLKKATPLWADIKKISLIFEESKKLTELTGIKHNVDHIIPLNSKIVCGLHCEQNLRVITEFENISKHNKLLDEFS